MNYEIGKKLYLYIVRAGKFRVHEGEVTMDTSRWSRWTPKVVMFTDGHLWESMPKEGTVGRILSGQRLWLEERDDVFGEEYVSRI